MPASVPGSPDIDPLLARITGGELLIVNSRRRNGLILCKPFHAEFVGPGAAVGSTFDLDCIGAVPLGDLSLVSPKSGEERQNAYRIRLQWLRLTGQFSSRGNASQRAQKILELFEQFFEREEVGQLSDDLVAKIVGVLPYTIRQTRDQQFV
jgi:hypothetical protein